MFAVGSGCYLFLLILFVCLFFLPILKKNFKCGGIKKIKLFDSYIQELIFL